MNRAYGEHHVPLAKKTQNMKKLYTISVFSENTVGMLARICVIFTRRHINIESLNVCESEIKDVYRYTIIVSINEEQVKKVLSQIEKQIEVIKAFVHSDNEIVHQEIALYKMATSSFTDEQTGLVVRKNHARILAVDAKFIIIEKTGSFDETETLFNELKPFGILEFTRSGRVAITKPMKELSTYLKELEILN